MAGVITHLVIANEILKILPGETLKDVGLFFLGSFAPDAIHAREGYIRAYKKHTHFRDDILDRDFEKPENYAMYQKRLVRFILEHRELKDGLLDLYRGYTVHILADELFVLNIRKEFCHTMESFGIDQGDKPFFEYIVTDMNRNDMLLVNQYQGIKEIRAKLELTPIYPIDGLISAQELRISREWLLQQHFYRQQELLMPVYISYERMTEFIQSAARQITERLSDDIILPRMF
ncbi:MAG TPA: zinc dependent phospholipase C family protein [Mobilitalea sp.]|nr:zinc dependent phospholipase C family protein [Mobilitalea sp.]